MGARRCAAIISDVVLGVERLCRNPSPQAYFLLTPPQKDSTIAAVSRILSYHTRLLHPHPNSSRGKAGVEAMKPATSRWLRLLRAIAGVSGTTDICAQVSEANHEQRERNSHFRP
jgi:hypothetical protein